MQNKNKSSSLLFAGFGLAPLWIAILAVVVGGLDSHVSTDYWNTAPWLIALAIPACAVTLVIAGILAAFGADSYNSWKKEGVAVLVVVGVIVAVGGVIWLKSGHDLKVASKALNRQHEQQRAVAQSSAAAAERALRFVQANEEIQRETGGSPSASLVSTIQNRAGSTRYRFLVAVSRYAIVDDLSTPDRPFFNLACITSRQPSEAGGGLDDCADAR